MAKIQPGVADLRNSSHTFCYRSDVPGITYICNVKILVVRFSSIGDIVLTTPVLRALKQQLPETEIHYLTKRRFASIPESNPHVSKVFTIDSSIDEVLPELRAERYDHLVDLHHNIRTFSLKKKLRRPASSFPKLNWKKWLLVKCRINRMPDVHVVDRYFEAVRCLGVHPDNLPGEFYIAADQEVNTAGMFGLPAGSYVSVSIGAQFATKRMPPDLVAEVLNEAGHPAILLGGETDLDAAQQVIGLAKVPVYSACGKLSLAQSASVARQSRIMLTNDTGMMHIAACFQVPLVTVWGNTVPALGMYPYYPGHAELFSVHEVEGLACRPCSKIGHSQCPKGHFRCMKAQDRAAIARNVKAAFA